MASKIPAKARPSPPPKLPKPKVKSFPFETRPPFLPVVACYEPTTSLTGIDYSPRLSQNSYSSPTFHHKRAAATDVTEPLYQEVEGMADPIFLSEVVKQYSQDLPIVVRVRCSLYGMCDTVSLVEGELLNLHFLKETKCVQVSTTSHKEFNVPIDSTIQFSPLHVVSGNLEVVKQGSTFGSVNELMLTKPLPAMVCIVEQCGNENTNVAVGDILALKTVKKKAFGDGYLLCYNITKCEEVMLGGKWNIKFSTNPTLLKLYLPQFLDHIKLPQKVAVFFHNECQQQALGSTFRNQVCTILSTQTELSFITTFTRRDRDRTLIEIPSTVNIKVSVQKLSAVAKRQLVDETNDICENFDQEMVGAYFSTEDQSQANLHLRVFVRKGSWHTERSTASKHKESTECSNSVKLTENYYDYVEFTPGPAEKTMILVSKQTQDEPQNKDASGHAVVVGEFLKRHVKLRGKKTTTLTHQAKPAIGNCDSSATESDSSATDNHPKLAMSDADPQEVNKKLLTTLDCEQVLKVLDGMKLGMHKKRFKSEEITGDLMLELDDDILEQELGVLSRLHRIKLLKVITGKYSVQPFLDKQ